MKRGYAMVRDAVKRCPLPLLTLNGKLREYAESFLPYDTGIEIECCCKEGITCTVLTYICYKEIPEAKGFRISKDEFRARIPNGVNGLIALYKISEILKYYCLINTESGNHYHINFNDIPESEFMALAAKCMDLNPNWILKSLESWNYTGIFNTWKVSYDKTAVRFHRFYQTLEFRIGEMTFDYEILVKRILHCQNISRKIKKVNRINRINKASIL